MQRVHRGQGALALLELDARLEQVRRVRDGVELDALHLAVLLHERQQVRRVVVMRDVAHENARRRRRLRDLLVHRALHAQDQRLVLARHRHDAPVERLERVLAVGLVLVLHEAVAARAAGLDVDHDTRRDEGAVRPEPREEEVVVDARGQVRDVQVRMRLLRRCSSAWIVGVVAVVLVLSLTSSVVLLVLRCGRREVVAGGGLGEIHAEHARDRRRSRRRVGVRVGVRMRLSVWGIRRGEGRGRGRQGALRDSRRRVGAGAADDTFVVITVAATIDAVAADEKVDHGTGRGRWGQAVARGMRVDVDVIAMFIVLMSIVIVVVAFFEQIRRFLMVEGAHDECSGLFFFCVLLFIYYY